MINLLPPTTKESYAYAHRNARLMRFVSGFGFGLVGVVVVLAGAFLFLEQEINASKSSIADSEKALVAQDEKAVIAEVTGISNSITLGVDVLSKEVLFSELLRQVGAVMPRGAVLQNLTIGNDLAGAIDLEVAAVDYTAASQIQVNLRDPANKLFSSADTNSIDCDREGPYPCLVQLRALFDEEASFYLISPERGSNS